MKSNYVFFFLLQKFAILMEQVGLAHICTKNGHQKYWWCWYHISIWIAWKTADWNHE